MYTCMPAHMYGVCVCVFDYGCVPSLCPLSFSSCCRESAVTSKRRDSQLQVPLGGAQREKAAVDGPGEKMPIYSELMHCK